MDKFLTAFSTLVTIMQNRVSDDNYDKGFWDGPQNKPEKLMLMVTELAEACEGLRHGDPQSTKIPGFSNVEEELADCVIRILDFCGHYQLQLGPAIIAKLEYNRSRPHKHGKQF